MNEVNINGKYDPNKKQPVPRYFVDRDVFLQKDVIDKTQYTAHDKSLLATIQTAWSNWHICSTLLSLVPFLQWIPKYSIKNYLMGDIFSGITVAVMHIPQGMAYGLLAGVAANVGLYMAFFPTLMYVLLGTSRHISTGTFAVISLMTLKVVQTHATTDANLVENHVGPVYSPIEVATATAMTVGFLHLVMGFLRLGTLATLLSDPLVNGFTTAAAVHVVVSQLKDIFGVSVPKHKGSFKIVYTLIDLGKEASANMNLTAFLLSCCVILFMIIMNEFIKPWLSKRCRFPLPAELICVVGGTLVSKYADFPSQNVKVVGNLPVGLPQPILPRMELIPIVAVDSIAIAIVSYSIVISMSLTFAKKHAYEVSANQELFALGVSNIFGSFFSCIPLACSLSRSLIQEVAGGNTQIAAVISAMLILVILLWIGPFFETLPKCVLAGIIIVALKGMFTQAVQLKKYAKQGKLEVCTWFFTFLGVILIDIDIGLFMGICVSFLALYIKGWRPASSLLGIVSGSNIYVDISNHRGAEAVPHTKIFRYQGSLNFATRNSFKKCLYNEIGVDHKKIRRASYVSEMNGGTKLLNDFRILIIDLSPMAHIDIAGSAMLTEIQKEMKILSVKMYLANPVDRVYDTLMHSMALGEGPFEILATLHDAVVYARSIDNS